MIISIEEARKILGEEGIKMADEQIRDTILALDSIARETIRTSITGGLSMMADREKVVCADE